MQRGREVLTALRGKRAALGGETPPGSQQRPGGAEPPLRGLPAPRDLTSICDISDVIFTTFFSAILERSGEKQVRAAPVPGLGSATRAAASQRDLPFRGPSSPGDPLAQDPLERVLLLR